MRKIISLLLMLSIIIMNGIFVFAETNEVKAEDTIPNYVSAMVFLRYTNEVPENILQGFAQEGFGPAGTSNNPYFTVDVDLTEIESLCEQGLIKKYSSGEYVYYSAQENLEQSVIKTDAVICWNNILQAMSETDRQKFSEYFGTSNFIGYVFKLECDGWHIDGILDVKPGYVTEFYLNGEIQKTNVDSVAMLTNVAKENIEQMIGADSIEWNEDGMGGTFQNGDETYQFTVLEGDYSVSNENVQYVEKIQDAYYLARIYVTTEKIEHKPEPIEPPITPDPVIPEPVTPVIPPVIPDLVEPVVPDPVIPIEPQPLPPDDPLIEEPDEPTVEPQPLPPDDPLVEEPRPSKVSTNLDQPKTGDQASLMILVGLFLLSAGILSIIYIKRKL